MGMWFREEFETGRHVVGKTFQDSLDRTVNGGSMAGHLRAACRDRWKDPMTLCFDNYTLAQGVAAVDPARFDQQPPASR
jgi:hypothetical protein